MKAPAAGSDAERIVLDAQAIIARYLPPDSGVTADQCLNELIELLDGPRGYAVALKLGKVAPAPDGPPLEAI